MTFNSNVILMYLTTSLVVQIISIFIGTVVEQFDEPITKLKKSREYHTDRIGHINMSVGKVLRVVVCTYVLNYVCS